MFVQKNDEEKMVALQYSFRSLTKIGRVYIKIGKDVAAAALALNKFCR